MLEALVDRFAREWAVISQAPASFLVTSILVGTVVWLALRWQFGTQLINRDGILALKEAEINDYKRKLDGASPDEAAHRIEVLEKRLSLLEPRILSEAEFSVLKNGLQGREASVDVMHDVASPAMKNLWGQIAAAFHQTGWKVTTGMLMGLGNPPPTGIAIVGRDGSPVVEIVAQALKKAGIQSDIQVAPAGLLAEGVEARIVVATPIDPVAMQISAR